MLSLETMVVRLVVALVLGIVIGLERELVGKEAGMRTAMLVSSGAALFTMAGLSLPYIISPDAAMVGDIIARNSGFLAVIANIVVGIGFLGAGIIIKTQERVHGLTTAAVVWMTAAIGILAGIGLWQFAGIATVIIVIILYVLRRVNLADHAHAGNDAGQS
ncbi:MAG: MgtC/SapB family protein [Candidatus Paceibacterota bacterium]|jgi:putative Mg2+ transporter-C (MgtC) family protein